MGTKSVGRKGHEREKMNNAEESLSSEDEKKKTKGNEANGDDVEVSDIEIEAVNLGSGLNNQEIEKKKKKHKKRKLEQSGADMESQSREKVDEGHRVSNEEDISKMINGEEENQKKKNKKWKMLEDAFDAQAIKSATDGKEVENGTDQDYVEYPRKERKKKKLQNNVDLESKSTEVMAETPNNEINRIEEDTSNIDLAGNQVGDRELGAQALNAANRKDEKKRKKRKREKDGGDTGVMNDGGIDGIDVRNEMECLDGNIMKKIEHSKKEKKKKKKHDGLEGKGSEQEQIMGGDFEASDSLERSTTKGTSKRVSFSEDVVVFPSSDGPSDEETSQKEELVRGKRFSREEDEMVKTAVLNYINAHELGEGGLKMVLQCKKYPAVKNCWKEIGAALPWRPHESVYHRAHILFERGEKHTWSPEEVELVRDFHEKYGSDWKTLAEELGKHRIHVKDTWRRIKLAKQNKGTWSQEEYQNLFDLVNMDLRMKAIEEVKKTKHGMLRDNICWTAISDKLGTRATAICCMKWYKQLTSPMVAEGKWHDVDDYRLVIALYDLDACCMEDVDWDSLLEHRSGDVCRKRWNQMVKHVGETGNKSFADQVEALMNRYCPDVLEARETYNSKPAVS